MLDFLQVSLCSGHVDSGHGEWTSIYLFENEILPLRELVIFVYDPFKEELPVFFFDLERKFNLNSGTLEVSSELQRPVAYNLSL